MRQNWVTLAEREVWLLAVIVFVAGSLLVFGMLADEVIEQEPIGLDRALLLALRNPADVSDPIGPIWFEEMARDITSLGSHIVLIILSLTVIGVVHGDGSPGSPEPPVMASVRATIVDPQLIADTYGRTGHLNHVSIPAVPLPERKERPARTDACPVPPIATADE